MIKSEVVNVTPELAQKWLSQRRYDGQRTIRSHWVGVLADEMKIGRFVAGTSIRFENDGKAYRLVDGMHRLSAVVLADIPQTFTVVYSDASSAEDVATTYGMLDIGLRRTWSDMSSALNLTEELGLTNTQVNALGAAVTFIYSGFTRHSGGESRMSRIQIVNASREYGQAAGRYFEIIAGIGNPAKGPYKRASTLSVALVTLRYSVDIYGEQRIADFWDGVSHDDGLRVNDPRKHVYRHLMSSSMPMGGGTNPSNNRIVSPPYSARYIANCFNAYTENRTLEGPTKVMDAMSPIKINGSPFTGASKK